MAITGRPRTLLYTRVYRIRVTPEYRDLLPFFKMLDALPPGQRNAALLMAIRGGAVQAQKQVQARRTSARASNAIDAIANAFED